MQEQGAVLGTSWRCAGEPGGGVEGALLISEGPGRREEALGSCCGGDASEVVDGGCSWSKQQKTLKASVLEFGQ